MDKGVLIVDDSKAARDMVKVAIQNEGIFARIYEAADGDEAIGLLQSGSSVDMVLTDLIMPRVDGMKFLNWLRLTEPYRELPVLVLSVEDRGDVKAKGLNLGAGDYVVKPFDKVELLARIRLLLRRKDVQDELKRKNQLLQRLNADLKRLAVTDELTQLYNRSHFLEKMACEMRRCVRYGAEMTLLLIDLDDFKAVNDSFGHIAGDEVLKEVAAVLPSCVRDSDMVGRYGGEEFVVYLVHTGLDGAQVPAERVRASVAGKVFDFPGGRYSITASIGVAVYAGDPKVGRDDFINMADVALYQAKAAGKNRAVAYGG